MEPITGILVHLSSAYPVYTNKEPNFVSSTGDKDIDIDLADTGIWSINQSNTVDNQSVEALITLSLLEFD